MTNDRMTSNRSVPHLRVMLAAAAAVVFLAACSSSVVRENSRSGSTSSSQRIVSKPRYGASVRVERGDTLYGLAFRNGIDFRDLATWNGIASPYTIYPGQSLRLYPAGARTSSSTTSNRPANTVATGRPRQAASTLPPQTRPAPAPTRAVPVSSGFAWRWPADGPVIGSFSSGDATKQGVDIGGSGGQPVRAAGDGVVVYSGGGLVGYGELIIIKHSESWLSAYGPTAAMVIGQNVSRAAVANGSPRRLGDMCISSPLQASRLIPGLPPRPVGLKRPGRLSLIKR